MVKLLIALMMLSLVGCAALGGMAAKTLPGMLMGKKPAISADIRMAGEANDSVVIGDNERTDIEADVVQINKVIHNNKDTGLMILAMIGWACPTPRRMWKATWRGIVVLWKRRKKNG